MLLLFYEISSGAASEGYQVTGIKHYFTTDHIQLDLEINEKIDYQSFFLNNPERLVLDLKNTTAAFPLQDIGVTGGVVSKIRFGRFEKNTLRVAFDLIQPVEAKIFWQNNEGEKKYQLVVKLTRKNFPPPEGEEPIFPSSVAIPKKVVVIDPGHGGEDPGAIGPGGSYEKEITMAFARILKEEFERKGNYETILTRKGDYFLPLRNRIRVAEIHHADLFISLHADSNHNRYTRGASVYCLSLEGATDEATRCLAEKENAADLIAGIPLSENNDLNLTLLDLALTENINRSLCFGSLILREVRKVHILKFEKPKQAAFRVLKTAEVPSVLVELGFISNPQEELSLRHKEFQERIARAIVSAANQFFIFSKEKRLPSPGLEAVGGQ